MTSFLLVALLTAAAPRTVQVYHVGNSLTRGLTLDRLHQLMAIRGVDYQFGSHQSAGASLSQHVAYRERGVKVNHRETNVPAGETFEPGPADTDPNPKRFGPWDEAWTNHKWDAIVLQPFRAHLTDDLAAIRTLVGFALEKQATEQVYLYATWPRREAIVDGNRQTIGYRLLDFGAHWAQPYPPAAAGAQTLDLTATRDYYRQLLAAVKEAFPRLTVGLLPAGEVLYELDRRLKAGQVPGVREVWQRAPGLIPSYNPERGLADGVNMLYADGIHLNPLPHLDGNLGNLAVGLCLTACFTGASPVGLPGAIYGFDDTLDAALLAAVQQTVAAVVANYGGPPLAALVR